MGHALAIDVANDVTKWARRPGSGDRTAVADGATPSAVRLLGDGLVAAGADDGATVTQGFVAALGSSEPIIVGTTPYGPEALVAVVFASIRDASIAATGSEPDVVVVVHDDGLDEFRISLLGEAARLAGFAPGSTTLVARSSLDDDDGSPAAAALVAASALPSSGISGAAVVGGAGLVGAAGVAGVAGVAASDTVAAQGLQGSAAAGPAGTPLGPAGTPLGPAGTPLGDSSVPHALGPTDVVPGAARSVPRWVPFAAAAGAVAVVATVVILVFSGGSDEAAAPAATIAPVVDGTAPAGTEAPSVPTTASADPVTTAENNTETSVVSTIPVAGQPVSIEQPIGDVVISGTVCDFAAPFVLDVDTGDTTLTGVANFAPDGEGGGSYQVLYTGEGAQFEWTGGYTTSGIGTDAPTLIVAGADTGTGTMDGVTIELPDVLGDETLQFSADPGAAC